MGLTFYCGIEFHEHEYNQFQELKKILISKYEDSDEEIVVLYNFYIKDIQIDVALIMNNGILLLEMKDYEGEIYGDEEGEWYCKKSNGEKIKINSGGFLNPYIQCKAQRSMLTNRILELIQNKKLKGFPEEKQIISKSIKAWLYFNGSSIYKSRENQTENNLIKRNPWFNIVNAESLAKEIDKIGYNLNFIKEDVDVIVNSLNVRKCNEKIFQKELKNPEENNNKKLTIIGDYISPAELEVQPQPYNQPSPDSLSYRDELLNEIKVLYDQEELKNEDINKFSISELELLKYLKYVKLRYLFQIKTYRLWYLYTPTFTNEYYVTVLNYEFKITRKYYILRKGILKPKLYFTTNENYKSEMPKFKLYGILTLKLYFATKVEINGKEYIIDPKGQKFIREYFQDESILSLTSKIPRVDFIDRKLLNDIFIDGYIKGGR